MAYYRGKDIEKSRGNANARSNLRKKKCCTSCQKIWQKWVHYLSLDEKVENATKMYCWKTSVDHLDPSEKSFVGNM